MKIGLSLTAFTQGAGGISITINGLTGGNAVVGDHASITMTASSGTITARKWGSTPGGSEYGTGTSPTDFTAGEGGALYATATVGGSDYSSSASIVFAAPVASGGIADQSYAQDSAISTLDVSSDFTGSGITYALAPSSASLPAGLSLASNGEITGTPTTEAAQVNIVVRGTNSGGFDDTAFGVTITAPSVTVPVSFGALTLAGAGGVAKPAGATAISDAGGTNLVLSSGFAVPDTGGTVTSGTVVWDDGTEWTVTATANDYSCRSLAELNSAYAAASLGTAHDYYMRAGNYRDGTGTRWAPTARSFTARQRVIGEGFTAGSTGTYGKAAPKFHTFGVQFPAVYWNGTQFTELWYLDIYSDPGLANGNGSNAGVIRGDTGNTQDCGVFYCKVASKSLETLASDGTDETDNTMATSGTTMTGQCSHGINMTNATHSGFRVQYSYIKDTCRGIFVTNTNSSAARTSQYLGNVIEDVYFNFWTFGGESDNAEFFDNLGMHGWASGDIDSGSPHAATGMSGDAPADPGAQSGVKQMGNIVHVGWHRQKLYSDLGYAVPVPAATGAKTNDPNIQGSYADHETRFNVVVSNGQCLMAAGMDGWEVSHNLVLNSPDISGTVAGFYPDAIDGLKAAYNVYGGISNGEFDGDPGYVTTTDNAQGYGNYQQINTGTNGLNGQLTGIGGSFSELEIEELEAAFTPVASSHLDDLDVGPTSSLYSGAGSHSFTFTLPAPTGGTPTRLDQVYFDGATRVLGANNSSVFTSADSSKMTFLIAFNADTSPGGTQTIYNHGNGNQIWFRLYTTGIFEFWVEDTTNAAAFNLRAFKPITFGAWHYVAISLDTTTGQAFMAVDGVPEAMLISEDFSDGTALHKSNTLCYAGGTYVGAGGELYSGGLELVAIRYGEIIDMTTTAGLNQVYASDGTFRDLGTNGATAFSAACQLFLTGDSTTWDNQADTGTWSRTGLADFDSTAPTLSSPTAAKDGSTGATSLGVTTNEGNGTLYWGIYPTASTPSAADVVAGTGATVNGSQAVSTTGAQAVSDQTGLTASTAYKAHYVHDDAASNRSSVATSAEFTTDSATPTVELATFDSSTWVDLTADHTGNIAEGVYAFKVRRELAAAGGDTFFANSGAGSNDTYCHGLDTNDNLGVKLESNTGSSVLTKFSTSNSLQEDEELAVFISFVSGSLTIAIQGETDSTSAATFSSIKALDYINTSATDGTGAVAMGIRGFVAFSSAGAESALSYSDFFDGSNNPIDAAFSGSAVNGHTPDVAFNTVASWNAYAGTTGTVV